MRNNRVGATLVAHGEAEASPTRGLSCAVIYVAMYNDLLGDRDSSVPKLSVGHFLKRA